MSKIIYYFGAGASYGKRDVIKKGTAEEETVLTEGLPVVAEIPNRIRKFRKFIEDCVIDANAMYQFKGMFQTRGSDIARQKQEMLQDIDELIEGIISRATIDTYAKKLFLVRDYRRFNTLREGFRDRSKTHHVPEDFQKSEELHDLFWKKSFQELPQGTSAAHRLSWVEYWCQNTPLVDKIKREELAKEFYQRFCDIFGVLSLTANPSNDEMWKKYGANHKGFCVGYKKDILKQYVGGAGPVVYTNDLPHVVYFKDDGMTQHIKNVFFKEAKWDFEQEYKVHKIWDHRATNVERSIVIPVEAICEVIVGKNINEHDYNEIKAIVETKYPHASLRINNL